ncbi:retrovirus-related pol polyprotein from transposon tnt 1-94 [Lasius niger]|uniref:Retrovirus-related pol polyprotein from transposon tnt 1-94 n=1 Tax=Lasius niger TaxID=67767 RepID=A0A0J7KD14_LASNI|nr:retrovirus-related pol polyprotein from transposon tnt 1-94 [Lasius niger]
MLRNRFKRDIKVIKTDNGREYINEPFKKFVKARGMEHQTSAPYNPEQNGKSERDIQTINEMIRSMIYGRHLPKYLWSEAINMAAYILNRSVTSKSNKSLFERWAGQKPDLSWIKVFGCVAYTHVPNQQRRKLDLKAQKMIFVGYQENSNNCRLFDPKTRKITVAASVRFDEEKIYYTSQKTAGAEEEMRLFVRLDDENSEDALDQEAEAVERINTDEEEPEKEKEITNNQNKKTRVLRNRTKIRKPERLSYPQVNIVEAEPTTFEEALCSSEAKHWKEAIQQKLSAHRKNETWFSSPKSENKKVITCK